MMKRNLFAVVAACLAALCGGCAKPATVPAAATGGEVYLTMSGGQWRPREISYSRGIRDPRRVDRKGDAPRKFSVIKLKNEEGRTVGRRVVPVFSGEILLDVLAQRLQESGYSVKLPPKRPVSGYVIDISRVAADMEQSAGLITLEGKCALQARMDVWVNGVLAARRECRSEAANSAATGQDQLHVELMKEASQKMITGCIPELVKETGSN